MFDNPKLIAEIMRNRAEEMLQIAENFRHGETRRIMKSISEDYLKLAQLIEKQQDSDHK